MFRKQIEKYKQFFENSQKLWENEHAEQISECYNKIVEILKDLDIYSANMLINLLYWQIMQKTYFSTVGKKEIKGGDK
jgi:hypothetical protein